MQINEQDLKGKVILILDWRIIILVIVLFTALLLMSGLWYKEARVLLAEIRGHQELAMVYKARVEIYDRFLGLYEEEETENTSLEGKTTQEVIEEWELRTGQGE